MNSVLAFASRAVRLLLSIIYTFIKTLGVIALVAVLTALFVVALIVFFLFTLAVQEYRVPITVFGAVCFIVLAVWFLRGNGGSTDKEGP